MKAEESEAARDKELELLRKKSQVNPGVGSPARQPGPSPARKTRAGLDVRAGLGPSFAARKIVRAGLGLHFLCISGRAFGLRA